MLGLGAAACGEAALGVVFIVLTGILCKLYLYWVKKRKDAEEGEVFVMLVVGIILIVLVVACVVELFTTIPGFVNPEFYALKELLP